MGIIVTALMVCAFIWAIVVIFLLLWNTTMPYVFGLRMITFWQALRLLLLSGMIFSGISYSKYIGENKSSSSSEQIQARQAEALERISGKLDQIMIQLQLRH